MYFNLKCTIYLASTSGELEVFIKKYKNTYLKGNHWIFIKLKNTYLKGNHWVG